MESAALADLLVLKDAGVWGDEDAANGVVVLRSTNVTRSGDIDYSKEARRAIPAKKAMEKALREGDILLERSGGSPAQPVGRVAYFTGHHEPVVHGNFMGRLRPNPDLVEPRYLFRFLHRLHQTGGTLRYQAQTTGLRNLKFKEYERLEVPLPSREEQRRIADLLDETDRLERLRVVANQRTRGILPAVFIELFGDPSTWAVASQSAPLSELVTLTGGKTPSKARSDYWDGNVPWVSPKDMKTLLVTDSIDHVSALAVNEAGMNMCPSGAVLVVVRGMILARKVPVALVRRGVTINQDMKALVPKTARVTGEYVLGALAVGNRLLADEVGTAGHGTRKLDTDVLERIRIPVPSPDQLERVTKAVSACLHLLAQDVASSDALCRTSELLRSRLFSGTRM